MKKLIYLTIVCFFIFLPPPAFAQLDSSFWGEQLQMWEGIEQQGLMEELQEVEKDLERLESHRKQLEFQRNLIKDRIEPLQKRIKDQFQTPQALRLERERKRKPETKDEIEQRLRTEGTEGARRSDYWLWEYECKLAIKELKEQIEKLEKQLVVRKAIFGMEQIRRHLEEQSRIRRQLKESR